MPFKPGNPGAGLIKGPKGRKSISTEFALITHIDRFAPKFWEELERMIATGDRDEKKFAMVEFNKIQCKRIPQDITSGGKPIPIFGNVPVHNSNQENSQPVQTC